MPATTTGPAPCLRVGGPRPAPGSAAVRIGRNRGGESEPCGARSDAWRSRPRAPGRLRRDRKSVHQKPPLGDRVVWWPPGLVMSPCGTRRTRAWLPRERRPACCGALGPSGTRASPYMPCGRMRPGGPVHQGQRRVGVDLQFEMLQESLSSGARGRGALRVLRVGSGSRSESAFGGS